jgi:hypothetical protein
MLKKQSLPNIQTNMMLDLKLMLMVIHIVMILSRGMNNSDS